MRADARAGVGSGWLGLCSRERLLVEERVGRAPRDSNQMTLGPTGHNIASLEALLCSTEERGGSNHLRNKSTESGPGRAVPKAR